MTAGAWVVKLFTTLVLDPLQDKLAIAIKNCESSVSTADDGDGMVECFALDDIFDVNRKSF